MSPPIAVRTLVGAKGFESSLICLRSLVEYSADPIRLVIHEDGTLTDEHRAALQEINPSAEFVGRKVADEAVSELLARHPRCAAARRASVLFLKLFDIPLLSTHELAYIDSDIFFCRPYRELFHVPKSGQTVFMSDVSHAYAVRPWRLWPVGPIRLSGLVNTGIIVRSARSIDLDYLEWLLERLAPDPAFARRQYWAEQTCWAALASREPTALLDPSQYILASANMDRYHSGVVAIHFVSTYRGKLSEYRGHRRPQTDSPVTARAFPSRLLSSFGMGWSDIRRRL